MTQNESKAVNDLHEEIMDELRGEPVAVQVKVAFAVLVSALGNAARRDPSEMLRAAQELERIYNSMQ